MCFSFAPKNYPKIAPILDLQPDSLLNELPLVSGLARAARGDFELHEGALLHLWPLHARWVHASLEVRPRQGLLHEPGQSGVGRRWSMERKRSEGSPPWWMESLLGFRRLRYELISVLLIVWNTN